MAVMKPGLLVFGTGLSAGPDIQNFFQDKEVVQVACGEEHSAVVCASGRVYTFQGDCKPTLVTTLANLKITQAACGRNFTMYLTDQGELYACGKNNVGQLGLGHTRTITSPVRVNGLPPVKKAVAGYDFTLVLTVSGEVLVCGNNFNGELGLGHTIQKSSFTWIPNIQLIMPIDISCGYGHTALLSASQVLMVTGGNDDGQLGLGRTNDLSSFTPLLEPPSVVAAMSCGGWHTVILRVDGTVWTWGSNDYGQLGTGDTTRRSTPTEMKGLENHTITQVVAGWYHTALLTEDGDVLMCGRGLDGELGQGNNNLLVPTLLPKSPGLFVKQVAFAQNYTFMLVELMPNIALAPEQQYEDIVQDDQASSIITNWEKSIMRSLECPVCLKTMYAPIHMCFNGHNLCGSCCSNNSITVCPLCHEKFGKARNIALESISMEVELPCGDCLLRMPTTELEKHAAVCPKRKYSCPVQRSCAWSGQPDTMLAHASSAHPDQTWRDLPHSFIHSTADDLVHTDVLAAHDQVFTLHRAFNDSTGEFKAVVRYIGPPEDKYKFKLKLKFITDAEDLTLRRNLCADIETVENALLSSNAVLLKKESVDKYLQQGGLMCRAAILKI